MTVTKPSAASTVAAIAVIFLVFIVLGISAVEVGHVVRTWDVNVFGLEIGFAEIMSGDSSNAADSPRHVEYAEAIGGKVLGNVKNM